MEFKDNPNYLIHDDGRVQNNKTKRFLKPSIFKKTGYHYHLLKKDKGRKVYMIHQLVAEHYIPNWNRNTYVHHLNRIRSDNRYTNLIWCEEDQIDNIKIKYIYPFKKKDYGKIYYNYKKTKNKTSDDQYFYDLESAIEYKYICSELEPRL